MAFVLKCIYFYYTYITILLHVTENEYPNSKLSTDVWHETENLWEKSVG